MVEEDEEEEELEEVEDDRDREENFLSDRHRSCLL